MPVDFAKHAEAMGALGILARTEDEIRAAIEAGRAADRVTVIHVAVSPDKRAPGYEGWWDVPPAGGQHQRHASTRRARATTIDLDKPARRAPVMRIATAPVNWNNPDVPEYRAWLPYGRMMDEFVEAGYDATEWGPGMPEDPAELKVELDRAAWRWSARSWASASATRTATTRRWRRP